MGKSIYDEKITRDTDWGGDKSTGGLPVSGARVQEYIKGEILALEQAVNEAADNRVSDIDAEVDEDAGVVTVSLMGRDGLALSSCEIPMLGGNGGSSDATSLVLKPSLSKSLVKAGEDVSLIFEYDIVYSSGEDKGVSTGVKADLEVVVKNGSTVLYNDFRAGSSAGTYRHDIGAYLTPGTCDIYVKASWTAPDGTPRSKQRYLPVKVVALSLSSDFQLTAMLAKGGYGDETAELPFRVSGSGEKSVKLYVDGVEKDTLNVGASSTSTQRFLIPMGSMSAGAHSAQIVATMEADGRTLTSNSIYVTLLRAGAAQAVAVMIDNPDGTIATGGPKLSAEAFSTVNIIYGVYDSASANASATVSEDGETVSTLSLPRRSQSYSTRYTTPGDHSVRISCGSASVTIGVDVAAGDISISEADYGRVCRLKARGRSNSEAADSRARWADGTVDTTFEGVDWSSSGWTGESLHLINGAKATVNIRPFAADGDTAGVKADGRTIELTLRISRVNDSTRPIVSCMEGGKGFRIQGDEVAYLTGETAEYPDEDNPNLMHTREVKLSTNYVAGSMMKVTFVIERMSDRPVMHLYIDGNRCGADKYSTEMSFLQARPTGLTFDSAAADIDIESVRYYERALSDDEVIANQIADHTDITRMLEYYQENDVLDQEGNVSMQKLLERGKGVMLIVRPGLLDDVYATNNKKTDFTASLRYYPPAALGMPAFTCDNCNIRIQGTSSTKYPSKNIRMYLSKGPDGTKPVLMVGGEKASKYQLRPGAVPMNLFTAKSDYSDSSMSLNTGGARLFTDIMKQLDLLTPPQRHQKDNGGEISVRASIDGVPIDIFAAESDDSTPVYYGQYNLNNEKSKSGTLFGMEGVTGFTPECPIALESLNNSQPLCLFQVEGELEAALESGFDKAFEFNYPEDTYWSASSISDSAKESLASSSQQTAIRGLFSFIKACVPAGADPKDISTFKSQKFVDEVSRHFDVDYLLTYYLWTEFFVSVDQRAKNILWRTWDGTIWYPTYYDGDTQRGKRNDSFMAYGPDTERDTWDVTASKYAFEGHDSWLWCLCLANLHRRLATCAANLRSKLTVNTVLSMFIDEQSGNWCDRVFNRSGELKYITPAIKTMYGRIWPFIYALQGADRQHSEWFIRRRWALMDAKYSIGDYTSDNIECYLARSASDAPTVLKITGSSTYAYGYGTQNSANMGSTGLVQPGETATLSISEAFGVNDPVRVYGASRMRSIDATGAASVLKNGLDISKCELLEELDLHVPGGKQAATSWWIAGAGVCGLLRRLDLNGQTHASTESGSRTLNLRDNTRLEYLDARGTTITGLSIAPGAVISELHLPATLTALRLENLGHLEGSGAADGAKFSIESLAAVNSLTLKGCDKVDDVALIQRWLDEKTTPNSGCSLTAAVDWTLDSAGIITRLKGMEQLNITGVIHLGTITVDERDAIIATFGTGCFSPTAPLYVDFEGTVIMTSESNAPLMSMFYKKGLAAHETYWTMEEAAAVDDAKFEAAREPNGDWEIYNYGIQLKSLDELRYLTSLTRLPHDFFFNTKGFETITIPAGIKKTGKACLAHQEPVCEITFLPHTCPDHESNLFYCAGDRATRDKIVRLWRDHSGYESLLAGNLSKFTVTYID